jgi:hypothetical protein
VRATHGDDLARAACGSTPSAPRSGGQRVLDAATALARQSHIPRSHLTLVDRHKTYAHNDPNSAAPKNAFVQGADPLPARDRAPLGRC